MIPGFFTDIQRDVVLVIDRCTGKIKSDQEQDKRVALAALRIIAAIGMAVAVLLTVSAVAYLPFAPAGSIVQGAFGLMLYATCHDIYIMSKNISEQMNTVNKAVAIGTSILSDIKDLWNGKKDINDSPRHPMTENTFFRPLWDAAIARLAAQTQKG